MKNFLLDTNVISELIKVTPSIKVIEWITKQPDDKLFISVITISEIMRGVSKLDEGKKRTQLKNWIKKEIPKQFNNRILDFDTEASYLWGEWQGEADRLGKPYAVMDAQIAAIAARYNFTLVTRNTKDFKNLPIKIINPWK